MRPASSPMRLVCPGCGTYGTVETFAADADARVVAALLAKVPADLGTALLAYMRLWTPAKQALTWHRGRQILEALTPMIEAQSIQRDGRSWPAPPAAWIYAIGAMQQSKNLDLPLSSHGYLLQILAGQADKAEAIAEREGEKARADGRPTARHAEDIGDQAATHARNVRTAIGLVVTEATLARTRFREDYTADQARTFLRGRGFKPELIDAAIDGWQRQEALRR